MLGRRQWVKTKREPHLRELADMGQARPEMTREIRYRDREHAFARSLFRDAARVTVAVQMAMTVEHVQPVIPAARRIAAVPLARSRFRISSIARCTSDA